MRMRYVLLAVPLLGPAGAEAQTYDASQLPAIHGKVSEYSLTPRGDVDGLLLTDGTEVHLPPHLGTQLVFAVRPGDEVTIRGLRARAIPMVEALSVSNDATGNTVIDNGPGGPPGPGGVEHELTAQGRVRLQLHGPRGELNGVLLEDGTIVRLPPAEAVRLASELKPGATLYAQGEGVANPLGRVIAARSLGPDPEQLAEVEAPGPGPRPPGGPAAAPPPPPLGGPAMLPPPPAPDAPLPPLRQGGGR